jgi:hypothetical protein
LRRNQRKLAKIILLSNSTQSDELLSFLEIFLRAIYIFREILASVVTYNSPAGNSSNLFRKKICDHLFSAPSNTPEKANQV